MVPLEMGPNRRSAARAGRECCLQRTSAGCRDRILVAMWGTAQCSALGWDEPIAVQDGTHSLQSSAALVDSQRTRYPRTQWPQWLTRD